MSHPGLMPRAKSTSCPSFTATEEEIMAKANSGACVQLAVQV
jgi:hypothetical protein